MELTKRLTTQPKVKYKDESKLGFGQIFTDHMLKIDYDPVNKWNNARITPFEDLVISPACMVLHYGQESFEGLKAYRTESGKIQLFRPLDNFRRMNMTHERLCMPMIDEALALDYLKELIRIEKDWIPRSEGTSLYIRPTAIAMDPYLGVRASHNYLFYIILTPVGAYYPEGLKPVKIYVEKEYVRSVKGGTGFTKTSGNYAASILAGNIAAKNGYTQVLWLDAVHRKYIEEVGSMNIFFKINGEIITPALEGSVLPGITRASIIQVAKDKGLKVVERQISIDEVFEAEKSGALEEVFGTGTAAVVSPVGEMNYDGKTIIINDGNMGEFTKYAYDTLIAIQYGRSKDKYGWIVEV